MPESRTYIVTRTQQVKVTANYHGDAEALAVAALDGTDAPDVWGYADRNVTPESATTRMTSERTS